MLSSDRELLARMARINKALARIALPLANRTLDQEEQRRLGDELIAVGRALRERGRIRLIENQMPGKTDRT